MSAPTFEVRDEISATDDGDDDETFHLYCCDEDIALCGADIADALETDGGDDEPCLECLYLEEEICARCGT